MRNWKQGVGLGAVIALSVMGSATAQEASETVATVNGTEITLGHMITVYENLPEQYMQYPADVLWAGIMDQLINQQLLATAPEARNSLRVRLAVENERRALLAAQAATSIVAAATSEQALQDAYDAKFGAKSLGREFNASHILVETEAEADAAIARAANGDDFAALARELSTGPSGPNGGSLGWFGRGMMVQPFQDAVDTLEVGQVSGPVQTQFGWHVIKLNDAREQAAPPVEDVTDQLLEELQQQAISDALETLAADAVIDRTLGQDLDPSLLLNSALMDD
ncbi:MAG: peptidylprolyl isomerase [Pseudoprimorskyibacter sp.]|nr:peptidylprolyl isomerase [Pseudoprimorskyibacter sp.]